MLILSQPASSLLVTIYAPNQGFTNQIIKITGVITIQSSYGEWANITEIRLDVTKGGQTDSKQIPVNLSKGAVVLGSNGPIDLPNTTSQIINVTVNSSTNAVYGYGYGYGYVDTGYGYYGSTGRAFGYGYGYGYGNYSGTYGYNVMSSPNNAVIVYDIYWKPSNEGNYDIQFSVKVKDRDGSEKTFYNVHTISIQQQDTTPPEVGMRPLPAGPFETPERGSEVWGNVTLIIVAYDELDGSRMSHVVFYYQNETSDLVEICNVTGLPDQSTWKCYWNTTGLQDGRYNLTAVAYDNAGNNNSATTWVKLDNDRLVITASSDTVQTFKNQPVTFYANYTHYGVPIDNTTTYNGSCSISVIFQTPSPQGLSDPIIYTAQMEYNSTSYLYEHTNTSGFPNWGILTYTVTCNNTAGFENETKINTSWITYYRSMSGYVYDFENGTTVRNAIITIEQQIMSQSGPPTTGWSYTTTSNESGYYEIIFNGTENPIGSVYQIRARDENSTKTTPVLPPLPGPFPDEPNRSVNMFLVPAANLTLRAKGNTTFNAEIFDSDTGMPIKTLQSVGPGNYSMLLPAWRDYTIVVYKTGAEGSPPTSHSWQNANGSYYLEVNLTVTMINVTGSLLGVDNAEYYNITGFVGIGNFYPMDFEGVFNPQVNGNNYSVYVPGTQSGIKYVIIAYAKNSSGYYGGSIKLTAYNSDISNQNITLLPLYGTYRTGDIVNTKMTRFVFRDNEGNNVTGVFAMFNITTDGDSTVYVLSSQSNNYIDIPISQGSNVTANFFSPMSPPRKRTFNSTVLASSDTINVTLPKMEFKDPLSNNPLQNVSLKFIKYNNTCNTPYPSESCIIYEADDATHFDPMKAMMAGNLNIRTEQQNGMIVEFMNVDMINSGPPDAHFSPNATEEIETDDTFAEVWQVGSFAPEIYDYVLIGIPYNESEISEDDPVSIKFRYLYDDDMNVIWNASVDDVSKVVTLGYGDFNQSYFTTGINCSDTYSTLEPTGECWRNKTDNMVWFTIPHFSGGAPQIQGTKPTVTEEEEEERAPTGGRVGGGGAPLPPPLAAPSEFYESLIKYLRAYEPKIIVMTSDVIDKIGILEIQAVLEQTMSVSATVSKVSSLPSGVTEPEGNVLSFFEIVFTQYGTQTKVEPSGYFKHRVSKEWLSSIGAEASEVSFLKWDNGWIELSSEIVDEDDDYYYFKVNLDSFSLFAVVAKKKVAPPAPPIPEKTPEMPVPEETKEIITPPATPAPEKPVEGFPIQFVAIGLLIVIIDTVVAILVKRKR